MTERELPTEEMASWRFGRGFLLAEVPNIRFMMSREQGREMDEWKVTEG